MNTDFHCYVSYGNHEKLENYCNCKKPGTVVIYKYTNGDNEGSVVMVQITKHQTFEHARKITLSQNYQKNLINHIKSINYKRK